MRRQRRAVFPPYVQRRVEEPMVRMLTARAVATCVPLDREEESNRAIINTIVLATCVSAWLETGATPGALTEYVEANQRVLDAEWDIGFGPRPHVNLQLWAHDFAMHVVYSLGLGESLVSDLVRRWSISFADGVAACELKSHALQRRFGYEHVPCAVVRAAGKSAVVAKLHPLLPPEIGRRYSIEAGGSPSRVHTLSGYFERPPTMRLCRARIRSPRRLPIFLAGCSERAWGPVTSTRKFTRV